MLENLKHAGKAGDEQTCYFTPTETCGFPCPDILPNNTSLWQLFNATSPQYAGMDGVPTPRALKDVQAAADGLEIPWDATTIRGMQLIETEFIKADRVQRKAEADKVKR